MRSDEDCLFMTLLLACSALFEMSDLDLVRQILSEMQSEPLPEELIIGENHILDACNVDPGLLQKYKKSQRVS